jgi:hypothetical protein
VKSRSDIAKEKTTQNEGISRQPEVPKLSAVYSRVFQKGLYPNLSQYAGNRAQTVQSGPNGVFSFQELTSEPERNHPP